MKKVRTRVPLLTRQRTKKSKNCWCQFETWAFMLILLFYTFQLWLEFNDLQAHFTDKRMVPKRLELNEEFIYSEEETEDSQVNEIENVAVELPVQNDKDSILEHAGKRPKIKILPSENSKFKKLYLQLYVIQVWDCQIGQIQEIRNILLRGCVTIFELLRFVYNPEFSAKTIFISLLFK